MGPKELFINWHLLANTTERSVCGGNVALCQNTLTTCNFYPGILHSWLHVSARWHISAQFIKKTGNFLHTSISSLLNLKIGLLRMECFTAACLETADYRRGASDGYTHTHTHMHTRVCAFNGHFSGTNWVSRYQKGKTSLDFTEARDSGISWDICKSAPTSRQITMPALYHSVFYRPDALPAAQPTASKHWSGASDGHSILENISHDFSQAIGQYRSN